MSKRSLVIVLVAVLAIGAFGAWEASAQDPGDDDTPPCGEFYGHGMMRGHMMGGWNAPEDCPFADGTWTGPGMMGGWTGRGPMHGHGGMMGGWNMAEDFPFADSVELTLSEDEALAAALEAFCLPFPCQLLLAPTHISTVCSGDFQPDHSGEFQGSSALFVQKGKRRAIILSGFD